MKLQNLLTTKTARLHQQLHRRNRYRVFVRRIEIEITTADQQVLRVWSLEDHEPARLEHTACLIEKLHERFQRQMLGEMKRRNHIQARIWQRSEITERLAFLNIE